MADLRSEFNEARRVMHGQVRVGLEGDIETWENWEDEWGLVATHDCSRLNGAWASLYGYESDDSYRMRIAVPSVWEHPRYEGWTFVASILLGFQAAPDPGAEGWIFGAGSLSVRYLGIITDPLSLVTCQSTDELNSSLDNSHWTYADEGASFADTRYPVEVGALCLGDGLYDGEAISDHENGTFVEWPIGYGYLTWFPDWCMWLRKTRLGYYESAGPRDCLQAEEISWPYFDEDR